MNVLSLFDGMSCGMLALKRAGIPVTNYYASEIDKYAIQVSQKNFPEIIRLGDITKWKDWELPKIDLIIGGSPCQDLSVAGKGKGFEGERSGLFFVLSNIIKTLNPKYFMVENVKMKKEWQDVISSELGVKPVLINSALVSAQHRQRLYWCNFQVTPPDDKGIYLKDVLVNESELVDRDKSFAIGATYGNGGSIKEYIQFRKRQLVFSPIRVGQLGKGGMGQRIYSIEGKSVTLSALGGGPGAKTGLYQINLPDGDYTIRKLTPIECERLQNVPDNYTEDVSKTQRYKMLGNGWTVGVIAHIFQDMIRS